MRIHHIAVVVAAALLAGACASTPQAEPVSTPLPGETCKSKAECMADFDSSTVEPKRDTAVVGKPFRNWAFEITVSDVEITSSMEYKNYEGTRAVERPELGRFIVVPVRVTNVGNRPESFCVHCSSLIDAEGRTFTTETIYTNLGQGFDDDLQPDESGTGFMLFDVPKTVTKVRTIVLQPDPYMATENIPAEVNVS